MDKYVIRPTVPSDGIREEHTMRQNVADDETMEACMGYQL